MSKEKDIKINLPSLDDMFTTEEERQDAKLKRIHEIPLYDIDYFRHHPFKVNDDEDMMDLVGSIKENGLITPIIVRKKKGGRYEIVSGHRRKRACEILGMQTIRAEITNISRDEAIILMVDSNLQRSKILPSEKAFSYKMKMEALKRQGKRHDLSVPEEWDKFAAIRIADIVGEKFGDKRSNVNRYIRLTYLVPDMLDLVDEGKIGLRPAVEISYLPKQLQVELGMLIDQEQCTPTHAQARRMRKMAEDDALNWDTMEEIMQEEKPNQKEKIVIKSSKVIELFPKKLTPSKREEYLINAMKFYNRHLQKEKQLKKEER